MDFTSTSPSSSSSESTQSLASAFHQSPEYLALRPKQKKFIDCYLTSASLNATEAARQAGYGSPETMGPRLLGKLRHLLERRMGELREASVLSPREVMEGLSLEAKGREDSKASDRIKALEIVARIHGMLSDKLQVSLEPSRVRSELLKNAADLTQVVESTGVRLLEEGTASETLETLEEARQEKAKP